MSAYQGRAYSDAEVAAAIEEHAPWLTMADGSDASAEAAAAVLAAERADGAGDAEAAETAETQSDRLASAEEAAAAAAEMAGLTAAQQAAVAGAVEALLSGEVVAWFDGRAEVGARALGSRSMLADPRRAEMHEKVNRIKRREMFRPLAPSVLAEHAQEWFDGVPVRCEPHRPSFFEDSSNRSRRHLHSPPPSRRRFFSFSLSLFVAGLGGRRLSVHVDHRQHARGHARAHPRRYTRRWLGEAAGGSAPPSRHVFMPLPALLHALIPPPTVRSTQTVDKDDAPLYHALIFAFFLAAGVPLVLNTSYNSAVRPTPGSSNPRSFTSSAPLALS